MAIYRNDIVKQAEAWIGCKESNGSHKKIINIYNAHKPLARGYKVQYTDAWCATFVSAVAIECGATNIIPTECSCPQQIELFKKLGSWVESDSYKPSAGDIIYYDWADSGKGDNKGVSDHVGIVQKVSGNTIYVIEGNYKDSVGVRKLEVNGRYIRGYGVPKYAKTASSGSGAASVNTSVATVDKTMDIGDKVKLTSDAKYFNGKSVPAWVKKCTLYVRGFREDGYVIISILKKGAITGAVERKYLKKV